VCAAVDAVDLDASHFLPNMSHGIRTPPLRILAVDDAPQNLELLMLLLGASGHTIVPAHNGSEAVQLAGEQRFDLVLMDLQMPDMDGLAATRQIRAREAAQGLRRVPVIALSANAQSADRVAGLEAGMDAFVSKPIDQAELSSAIASVLGWQESAPQVTQLLNSGRGLESWGGQQEAYLRALRCFAAEYAKLPTLLSSYAAFGGASEACALAHRVNGTAADLGLEALASLLQEFERHAINDTTGVVPPLLAQLRDLLYDTQVAIDVELAKLPASTGLDLALQAMAAHS
jgi:CheY-like chemotaxis protein